MEAELQELVPDEVPSSPLSEIYCLHRSSYKDAPADCFPLDVSKILPRVRRIVSIHRLLGRVLAMAAQRDVCGPGKV